MRPKLLLLTNPNNSEPQEDIFLGRFLSDFFDITLSHPFSAKESLQTADIILIRNIWPTKDNIKEYLDFYRSLNAIQATIYNPFNGRGDMRGKTYLPALYSKGYPVIPSILSTENMELLGTPNYYLIKPINGGSSEGVEKVSLHELQTINLADYIIQPYLDIKHEVSFYFIDGILQHTLYNPDPSKRWELATFEPSQTQVEIALSFVKWNSLSYGIQRVDFCITADEQFLLIEIEDWCPYLSLLEIESSLRDNFLGNLVKSLQIIRTRS